MSKFIDLTGKTFERWTVIKKGKINSNGFVNVLVLRKLLEKFKEILKIEAPNHSVV